MKDARARRVVASAPGLGSLVQGVLRVFGPKGIFWLVGLGLAGWVLGIVDPVALLTGNLQTNSVTDESSGEENERLDFVRVVLADTEDIWARELGRVGTEYLPPELVVFRDRYPTACGVADARGGPFYCPPDRTIYIDLSFYDELEREFDAPGDFAQAYVIAHEVGHHVQKLLGITDQVASLRGRPDYNQHSVRLELQADYLAGVWARHNQRYLEQGDIEEAMRAANRIGDDAIQKRTQGRVVPHAFTHGTSEQRMRWFHRGLESGRLEEGDTFEIPYAEL